MKLRTTCYMETPVGFFGINADGYQPDCGYEPECVETNEDGSVRPCYAVQCSSCNSLLEWPQEWEIVDEQE